jgi:hypothetical protein
MNPRQLAETEIWSDADVQAWAGADEFQLGEREALEASLDKPRAILDQVPDTEPLPGDER